MDWAADKVAGRKRASYHAGALRAQDEVQAVRLLSDGLERLGLSAAAVVKLKQSDPRKQALAWLMKSQTIVADEWIAARLQMGDRSNISRAVSAFRSPADRERRRLRKLLHICTD